MRVVYPSDRKLMPKQTIYASFLARQSKLAIFSTKKEATAGNGDTAKDKHFTISTGRKARRLWKLQNRL